MAPRDSRTALAGNRGDALSATPGFVLAEEWVAMTQSLLPKDVPEG